MEGLNDGLIDILNPPYPFSPTISVSTPPRHDAKLTVLNRRRTTIRLGRLVPHDKHWNFGPIFGFVPNLFRGKFVRPETFHMRRVVYAPRGIQGRCGVEFIHIEASNNTWVGETCHGNKDIRMGTTTKHLGSANERWFYACQFFPGQGIEVYFVDHLTCLRSVRGYHQITNQLTLRLYLRANLSFATAIMSLNDASFSSGIKSTCIHLGSARSIVTTLYFGAL